MCIICAQYQLGKMTVKEVARAMFESDISEAHQLTIEELVVNSADDSLAFDNELAKLGDAKWSEDE